MNTSNYSYFKLSYKPAFLEWLSLGTTAEVVRLKSIQKYVINIYGTYKYFNVLAIKIRTCRIFWSAVKCDTSVGWWLGGRYKITFVGPFVVLNKLCLKFDSEDILMVFMSIECERKSLIAHSRK